MIERLISAIVPLIVSLVILGAFGVQVFVGEEPCPLCYLQRVGMLIGASGFLLNLRFGSNPVHYGIVLLGALFGGGIALRQIALHVCPGFPPFGSPVFGLSLYTWSFIIHVCFILAVIISLFFVRRSEEVQEMNRWEKGIFYIVFLVLIGNILSTLLQCGIGPCPDVV